jgi:competence protein ComEA
MKARFNKWICAASLLGLSMVALADPVDINRANAEELANALQGVGEARAEAIVEYRSQNGPFASIDDLVQVDGIGTRIVDMNRDVIRVEGSDRSG